MNFFKNIWNKIKNPHGIFLILFYILFVLIVSVTIVLLVLDTDFKLGLLQYVLWGLSATALTYFVYSIVVLVPKIKNNCITILRKYKFTTAMLDSFGFRTIVFSIFSFVLNIAYVVFQGVFAIVTGSAWYFSITAYYLTLSLMKGNIFHSLTRYNTPQKSMRAYRYCGIMFIVLTLAMLGMIVLIYTSNMYFEYAGMMIYVVAAYTFYNLTMSIINIFKARKQDDLYVQSIRNINLVTSLVSIFVLQVAMFQAFSPINNTSFANGLTGACISLLVLALGIFMINKSNKLLKNLNNNLNVNKSNNIVSDCEIDTNNQNINNFVLNNKDLNCATVNLDNDNVELEENIKGEFDEK